jgi:hypothetical protein
MERDAGGLQNCKSLSDFTGFLAFFKINDEPESCTCGQRQILLCDTQALSRFANELTDVASRVFHG